MTGLVGAQDGDDVDIPREDPVHVKVDGEVGTEAPARGPRPEPAEVTAR